MTLVTDAATPGGADPADAAVATAAVTAARAPGAATLRGGAELVGLTERFYLRLFRAGVAFVGAAALAALALLPLRATGPEGLLTPAVVLAMALLAASPLAAWRTEGLYRVLLRRREAELAVVAAAALLISYPMRSQLWWPSCALVMVLAIVVPVGRTFAYCVLVLSVSAVSHLAGGDLGDVPAVTLIGLGIGYPLWAGSVALIADRLAAHLLRRNRTVTPEPAPPPSWSEAGSPASVDEEEVADAEVVARPAHAPADPSADAEAAPAAPAAPGARTDRLTARQLEVVALLAEGLRYGEVAACLSISERQVQRHVARAVARLGARNAYELVAVAVAEGLVPAGEVGVTRRSP